MVNIRTLCLFGILISTNFFCVAAQYSIVFVHLGNRLPDYLNNALAQARLFNPEADIYLVQNQGALATEQDHACIEQRAIKVVFSESLPMSRAHRDFVKNSPLDNNYREGFWKKASERFFCLEEFIKAHHLSHVFHLENDVMLYANLKEMLPVFYQYLNIAAVFDNDERCIPSFMYIAHESAITDLVQFFADKTALSLNDMQLPALYKKCYGRDAIDHLPLIMPSYTEQNRLKSAMGHIPVDDSLYYHKFNQFNSIFDAAALGQYLGGIDPRNGESKPGFINESCLFDPSKCIFEWILDEVGRKVPHICYGHEKYRINNLHIHCKNLRLFAS